MLITCEHASKAFPPELRPGVEDHPYIDDHWGWDVGAAELARALGRLSGAPVLCSEWSRLVVDVNRAPGGDHIVRRQAGAHAFGFNAVDAAEVQRRMEAYWAPFHARVDEALHRRRPALLLSIHSFTPQLGAEQRPMHLGVLFSDHDALAHGLAERLSTADWQVALNAPYSGKEGLIYSVERHGRAHAVPFVEIEVRNDLIADAAGVARVAAHLHGALPSE